MAPGYFEYLRDFLKQDSGLIVTPEKMYLLETRLMPLARSHGFDNLADLVAKLQRHPDKALLVKISEAMNTHESLFFRDQAPFKLFQDVILDQLIQRRATEKRFRIWCAACSTGQEPYSLAMALREEAAKLNGWQAEIVATDISHSVLERAQEGLYSQFEVQRGLPVTMLVKHFTQDGEYWRLNQDIRDMVTFKPFNLLDSPKALGPFDIVMCRNVLIYFDVETKRKVLSSVSNVLREDGVLFLGSAESTMGLSDDFWPVEAGRGVYRHHDCTSSIAEEPA